MTTARPTFHESWYRISTLKPRLGTGVNVYRQQFRKRLWYVLEDPVANEFSRISQQAYQFIALLDGERTVDDVWEICNEQMGDDALTQGEVVQLLGRLYTTNLLHADLPPDSQTLLNRYHSRKHQKIRDIAANLLFVKIPLFDPDTFLNRWVGVFGRVFSKTGFFMWLCVLMLGLFWGISNAGELVRQSADILAPGNFFWLYLSSVMIKIFHEFSHAFACKKLGQAEGNDGQVHTMGLMFLVFIPLPFVDASSAWTLRSKWHRMAVGAAGIMTDLFIASIAMIFWANTSTGTLHIIAYNMIFIAGISTLLFNGNPLLRFDAYYILADLIEIPNLSSRAQKHLHYLVKRYAWNIVEASDSAYSTSEGAWFVFYGIASWVYRIFISVRIILFLSDRLPEELFLFIPILIASALFMWIIKPLHRFASYMRNSNELQQHRPRAVGTTAAAFGFLGFCLLCVPVSDYVRLEGIVEPVDMTTIYAQTEGRVQEWKPSSEVTCQTPLVKTTNPELETKRKRLTAEKNALEIEQRLAQTKDLAAAQFLNEQIKALDLKIKRVNDQLESLDIHAPLSGTWIASDISKKQGLYLTRGQEVGFVGNLDRLQIRATAGQAMAAALFEQTAESLEIRVKNHPHKPINGTLKEIFPAGSEILPSRALGYSAGGAMATAQDDRKGTQAAENFFEIRIIPENNTPVRLLVGQRVIARIELSAKPLAVQWWTSLRQLFQRRYYI